MHHDAQVTSVSGSPTPADEVETLLLNIGEQHGPDVAAMVRAAIDAFHGLLSVANLGVSEEYRRSMAGDFAVEMLKGLGVLAFLADDIVSGAGLTGPDAERRETAASWLAEREHLVPLFRELLECERRRTDPAALRRIALLSVLLSRADAMRPAPLVLPDWFQGVN